MSRYHVARGTSHNRPWTVLNPSNLSEVRIYHNPVALRLSNQYNGLTKGRGGSPRLGKQAGTALHQRWLFADQLGYPTGPERWNAGTVPGAEESRVGVAWGTAW